MKKRMLAAAAAFFLVVAAGKTAQAGCCGEVAAISSASAAITGAIAGSTLKIVSAIAASGDVSNALHAQTIGAMGDDLTTRQILISNAEVETEANQIYGGLPPKACDSFASASVGGAAREGSGRTAEQIGANFNRRGMTTGSQGVAVKVTYDNHRLKYCSEESAAKGRCKTISKLPNGDIEPRSLLTGAGKAGKVSYTFDEQQVGAGQDYVANIIQPITRPQLTPAEENSEKGKAYVALRLSEQAKYNLAALPGSEAIAWRSPVKVNDLPLGRHIKNMWEKMSGMTVPQDIKDQLTRNNDEASYFFFQQTEIDRRVNNPGWYQEIGASTSATDIAAEQAYMTALGLSLQFEQLRMTEKTNLLLGGIYAEMIRQPHNDQQVVAQHRQAIAVAQ